MDKTIGNLKTQSGSELKDSLKRIAENEKYIALEKAQKAAYLYQRVKGII